MSFIDDKYIGLVSSRLQKFKKVKNNLYNFRCPYCGDSQKNKNKTRGYIYQLKNDHNYKCHNCGVSKTFTNFLKDLDQQLYDRYVLERYKNGLTGKGSQTKSPEFKFEKPNFSKKSFDLQSIDELDEEHPAKKYLMVERNIPKKYFKDLYYCENFKEWTNEQKDTFDDISYDEPRIIIPLKDKNKIIGYQGRSLNKNSRSKYITIMLDENAPKIYGLNSINWDKIVYVVEGPFDSMFIENSLAMVGSDINKSFFNDHKDTDFVIVYDNEKRNKQIVEKMEKAIDSNFSVVIWPEDLKSKDINDMVLDGLNIANVLESNTHSGLEAKIKFNKWKRV